MNELEQKVLKSLPRIWSDIDAPKREDSKDRDGNAYGPFNAAWVEILTQTQASLQEVADRLDQHKAQLSRKEDELRAAEADRQALASRFSIIQAEAEAAKLR